MNQDRERRPGRALAASRHPLGLLQAVLWALLALLLPLGASAAQVSAGSGAPAPSAATARTSRPIDSVVTHFEARRYREAKAIAERLVKADRGDAAAAFWLGRIYYVERRLDRAASWFETAAELDPRNAMIHHWLGVAYGRQAVGANPLRQAVLARRTRTSFERAVSLDPEMLESRQFLVQYYLIAPSVVGGSIDKARAQAREIAKRDVARGHLAMGAIHDREDDVASAEREYLAAIKAAPDSLDGYYGLALMYQRTKQYAKAFDTYERVLGRRPAETRARYLIGRTAALSGERLERGETALREYLRPRPDASQQGNASAHYLLGVIYEKRGDAAAAKREYDQSKKMDPQQAEARTLERIRDS